MRAERIGYLFMVPTILNAINQLPGIEEVRFPDLKCMMGTPCIRSMGRPRYYLLR